MDKRPHQLTVKGLHNSIYCAQLNKFAEKKRRSFSWINTTEKQRENIRTNE